ncbi:hypothetical protein BGZ72_003300 [Mortierella alpina]|nr:hypothetical protein BGZ72_003300 [Mortierella alpina]
MDALAAYGSDSDESDSGTDTRIQAPKTLAADAASSTVTAAAHSSFSSLSSMLPPPKAQSTSNISGQTTSTTTVGSAGKVSKYASLPTMDSDPDSDSDDESEFRKKAKIAAAANAGGSGVGALFAMLPAPKNAPASGARSTTTTVAGKPVAAKSAFMPRTVKKPTAVTVSQKLAVQSKAAKNEGEEEDENDDDDDEPVSFFPLGAQVNSIPSGSASASSKAASSTHIPFFFDKKPLTTEEKEAQNATLVDVSLSNEQYAYPTNDQYAYPTNDQYAYPTNDQYAYPTNDQYSYSAEGHVAGSYDADAYAHSNHALSASTGGRGSNTIELDDVGLQKLGMRKARDGPINVIDVYAKDQMNHAQQVRQAASASNTQMKPVDLGSIQHLKPTAGQKRKHNIMSLAYQAKANEQQLNASWASSRQTKAETQSKYGF